MKGENSSTPHAMGKCELAMAYAPDIDPKSAVNRLSAWMRHNPDLMAELAATHYNNRQKMLTARQVALVYQYLGEP